MGDVSIIGWGLQGPHMCAPGLYDCWCWRHGFRAFHLYTPTHSPSLDAPHHQQLSWRLSDEPLAEEDALRSEEERAQVRTKIFLGYTSNLVSAGVREHIRYLVQHRLVDVLVTTAGGIEEDYIKVGTYREGVVAGEQNYCCCITKTCLLQPTCKTYTTTEFTLSYPQCMAGTYLGDFALPGADLRRRGLNRIGNMLVPNDNYCKFEDWVMPILDAMLREQREEGVRWTPSRVIARLGREIAHPDSIYYWAWKHGIPVYCPALTDGSLGDMLYFHAYKSPGLEIDIVADIRAMNDEALKAAPRRTGAIILGGGVPKHHICNANLMRNGADFAVFLNTAQEFDGSDSGARPDEAVSWGKIRADARPVKVYGDASLLFPLLISQTFLKEVQRRKVEGQSDEM